ncbi:MAG: CO dehydrogenase/CO-methylating acetyl-CoA synthase complex subunit beta [Candidatus Scalindua sp. AMX11]|nr:MAG: CO dehydrogenase/CO-methylating acetyl-CoA synthase complex subunit beta [Candidatus Scalindua sp.]NOG83383.1 CO dehydrogenase/CO-methylating acetyl-CoA synthase complex subunit beta [Planctomycetota bacterium]RZV65545.1 MAG: CO dehydrogenase/CO-methylating acetyl-CoA synthase complex subunit beta [Candidatus Scalindua sp. SCAELEC01]TDE63532.1 MAG: CO dehydrogenase/CO-methylating acetyl-CoA synthase complex subunit beta [Candidatus Scalindua sp. AMX11]GJQ60587.1 MAG: acetyl-CoA decarbon
MSRIIATAAIRGAHSIVKLAEDKLRETIELKGKDAKVEFPDTGYYLPIIYSATKREVKTLSDCEEALGHARALLPPIPEETVYMPYLGGALDAGIATLFAEEVIEACKYLIGPNPVEGIWLGAAADVILRERGIEFVDGTAPGFAAVVGAAPTNEIAVKIARELQEKNLYVFISGNTDGKSFAEQLDEEGVQLGWETRLVPFGKSITATIYSLGFANKAALSFGGIAPADFRRNLLYNKNRIFAFVMALGEVDDEKYANAAGAINYGFPTIADTDIPAILPTGVCTYEHVVPLVPHDKIVEKCIEVRGLKVAVAKVDIPVAYGPAFEGERIRKGDMQIEVGGPGTPAFEYVVMRDNSEIEDGKVEVVGPDMDDMEEGSGKPLGIYVEVSGRKMQSDFEPIFERRTHHFLGEAQGFFHMGQRDIIRHRISKDAFNKGFRIKHIGNIIHSKYHEEYGALLDKVQVTLYTKREDVEQKLDEVRAAFTERDERALGMTDASVNQFYSCTLCQSFAPSHVCIISPERSGLCGAVSWLDGKAGFELTPTGPNQPIEKGKVIDEKLGLWEGTNDFLFQASNKEFEQVSMYSMVTNPMTSCGCFECISAMLPTTNGIMTVDRDYTGMTPCGMKFSTLAGTVGGGIQTPGFVGHSKFYMGSTKFISGDGGLARLVWMPKQLKDETGDAISKVAEKAGLENFLEKIADETIAQTEEEVLEHLQKVNHPVLQLEPMF